MNSENTDKDWKAEAPLLAGVNSSTPFAVPEEYFSELQNQIEARCRIEDLRFNNEDEFAVPENYFPSLQAEIESRISLEQLAGSSQPGGFSVSEDYFAGLTDRILSKTVAAEIFAEVPVRKLNAGWLKYAAAASVVFILSFMLYFNRQPQNVDDLLSKIPDQEMINYLQNQSDPADMPLIMESINGQVSFAGYQSEISEADMEEYINNTLQ